MNSLDAFPATTVRSEVKRMAIPCSSDADGRATSVHEFKNDRSEPDDLHWFSGGVRREPRNRSWRPDAGIHAAALADMLGAHRSLRARSPTSCRTTSHSSAWPRTRTGCGPSPSSSTTRWIWAWNRPEVDDVPADSNGYGVARSRAGRC